MAVSVDRFLAVHLHLGYQEPVTHKRVGAAVDSIWVFSTLSSLAILWVPLNILSQYSFISGVVGLALTAMIYIRIYLAVRRHKNQIRALQVQQAAQKTGELVNFASLVKSAAGIFYIYLLFLVCYLPFFIGMAGVISINGPNISLNIYFFLFSCTLVNLNSSLNPVIYFWKMRHIQHAIVDILRNMSWSRNRASH